MRMKISSKIMNSKIHFSTVHSSVLLMEIVESYVVIVFQKTYPDGKSFYFILPEAVGSQK